MAGKLNPGTALALKAALIGATGATAGLIFADKLEGRSDVNLAYVFGALLIPSFVILTSSIILGSGTSKKLSKN